MKPAFCANCTAPCANLVQRGHHWLCPSCDPESAVVSARYRLGPERGYDVPEKHAPTGGTLNAFARAANRVTGPVERDRGRPMTTEARPGFVMIRVKRRRADGTPIDAAEARETLRGEPWFAEVQHRGSTMRHHLFNRPDVDLAREVRSRPNVDPMVELREAAERAK